MQQEQEQDLVPVHHYPAAPAEVVRQRVVVTGGAHAEQASVAVGQREQAVTVVAQSLLAEMVVVLLAAASVQLAPALQRWGLGLQPAGTAQTAAGKAGVGVVALDGLEAQDVVVAAERKRTAAAQAVGVVTRHSHCRHCRLQQLAPGVAVCSDQAAPAVGEVAVDVPLMGSRPQQVVAPQELALLRLP